MMKNAVNKVLSKKMGYKKAVQAYSIPQTTLECYVKKLRQEDEVTFTFRTNKDCIFSDRRRGTCRASKRYEKNACLAYLPLI